MSGPPISGNVRGPRAVVLIPARWGSIRFPGKVLAPLAGRSMLLRVCDLARRARELCPAIVDAIVATDDERVADHVRQAGYEARMTSPEHASGTDRIAEVARELEAEIVVGLQADEPLLAAEDLIALVSALSAPQGATGSPPPPSLATLSAPISTRNDWLDPNVVKVVVDRSGTALYFSRAPIPYASTRPWTQPPSGDPPDCARVHIGVYAWRKDALIRFTERPVSPLEKHERLEQLRALEAGERIQVCIATGEPIGIDTPEDLRRAERRLVERSATDSMDGE